MKTLAALLALALVSLSTQSQEYPQRQVRMLVGYPPGGGMDTLSRVIAPKLTDALGQPFVIENRPGTTTPR